MPDHRITPPTDDSIRRIVGGLRTALRLSGISHRACERELGLSVGYLSRILAGQVQLRVSVVLGLCRMIGLPPAAFLTALFPDPEVSEPTDRVLRGIAAVHRPHPSSAVAIASGAPADLARPLSLDDVLLQLRDAVRSLETFAELIGQRPDKPGQ